MTSLRRLDIKSFAHLFEDPPEESDSEYFERQKKLAAQQERLLGRLYYQPISTNMERAAARKAQEEREAEAKFRGTAVDNPKTRALLDRLCQPPARKIMFEDSALSSSMAMTSSRPGTTPQRQEGHHLHVPQSSSWLMDGPNPPQTTSERRLRTAPTASSSASGGGRRRQRCGGDVVPSLIPGYESNADPNLQLYWARRAVLLDGGVSESSSYHTKRTRNNNKFLKNTTRSAADSIVRATPPTRQPQPLPLGTETPEHDRVVVTLR
eukprot:PhM_4_TR16446/c0_g1_i1/m.1852